MALNKHQFLCYIPFITQRMEPILRSHVIAEASWVTASMGALLLTVWRAIWQGNSSNPMGGFIHPWVVSRPSTTRGSMTSLAPNPERAN